MMAAIHAAKAGAKVTLFERNDRVGRKLRITGKGRCNLTNNCPLDEFLSNVPTNPKFLYTPLDFLSVEDTMALFAELGVPLKTERGKRVFPVSDKAEDVAIAMDKEMKRLGVGKTQCRVEKIVTESGQVSGIVTPNGNEPFDAVIVATGGLSYPLTGSDGDGYRFASSVGHTVLPLRPSLVPLVGDKRLCASMQGLSLRNVGLKIYRTDHEKCVYEDFGEMMFTHFGLTGPMILSASAMLDDPQRIPYEVRIDLKPALDWKTLDARVRSDFLKYQNRDLQNAMCDLLPQKMILPFLSLAGLDERKKVNSITREEREKLIGTMKSFPVKVTGFRPIAEAIITRGGVSVKEINPKTMESKLVKNLYFAGEVLDLDAYTGGFNLQIAFSTGAVAGNSAGKTEENKC